jgi:hypothetical protein
MKKILIASFFAIILLMVPFTAVAQSTNLETIKKISTSDDEMPQIFITQSEREQINQYIYSNIDTDLQAEAGDIVNKIINPDNEVNVIELSNALYLFGFRPIPQEEFNNPIDEAKLKQLLEDYWRIYDGEYVPNPFGGLINKIIEIIKGRLGWFYTFFSRGIDLVKNGIVVIIDFIQLPIEIVVLLVALINQIFAAPQLIADLLNLLFTLQFSEFIDTLIEALQNFTEDLLALIDSIIQLVQGIIELRDFLVEIQDFILWLEDEPWKEPITVTGQVLQNLVALPGATISCRGETGTTDSNGVFEFEVEATPSEDSIPSGQWYGMHNCAITVSMDGEVLKSSPALLSYVFSGGEMQWTFLVWKSRSRGDRLVSPLINTMLQRIQIFISNIFDNIELRLNTVNNYQYNLN